MENQLGSVECGNRQDILFDEIPNYALGETPVIVDMLADLRHLCDALELDFAACDKIAYGHYMSERCEL
jgi:hypothetical protein